MTTMISVSHMINLHVGENDGKNEGERDSRPVFRIIALLSQHNAYYEELKMLHLRVHWAPKALITTYN